MVSFVAYLQGVVDKRVVTFCCIEWSEFVAKNKLCVIAYVYTVAVTERDCSVLIFHILLSPGPSDPLSASNCRKC